MNTFSILIDSCLTFSQCPFFPLMHACIILISDWKDQKECEIWTTCLVYLLCSSDWWIVTKTISCLFSCIRKVIAMKHSRSSWLICQDEIDLTKILKRGKYIISCIFSQLCYNCSWLGSQLIDVLVSHIRFSLLTTNLICVTTRNHTWQLCTVGH